MRALINYLVKYTGYIIMIIMPLRQCVQLWSNFISKNYINIFQILN